MTNGQGLDKVFSASAIPVLSAKNCNFIVTFSSFERQILRTFIWNLRNNFQRPILQKVCQLELFIFFNFALFRYMDYPITDVLQMVGRANRPLIDDAGNHIYRKYHLSELPPDGLENIAILY